MGRTGLAVFSRVEQGDEGKLGDISSGSKKELRSNCSCCSNRAACLGDRELPPIAGNFSISSGRNNGKVC